MSIKDADYSLELNVEPARWAGILEKFSDANVYQSLGYGLARVGRENLFHLVVGEARQPIAAVQARMVGLPMLRLGMAYIRWGPMWRSREAAESQDVFRRAVRAVREEYASRRGLIVRMLPAIMAEENDCFREILIEEGYQPSCFHQNFRTILMDLRPSLEEIEQGCHQKWRKNLNRARKNNLEIIEGSDPELFDSLGAIYNEMVVRKGFAGSSDIHIYKKTQELMRQSEKMRIILCKADGETVAGALCSSLGHTGIDLFRATSDKGVKTFGSFMVQWKVVEYLKQQGCQWYNLNSINPVANPGGYQFKSQMAGKKGREVSFIGAFDAYPSAAKKLLLNFAQRFLASLKQRRSAKEKAARPTDPTGSEQGTDAMSSSRQEPAVTETRS